MNSLHQFLDAHRVEKGMNFSHTSLGYPRGSFYVPSDRTDDLFSRYAHALLCDPSASLHLTEKHREVSPVLVDLDFKYNGCDLSRRYTRDHVRTIVGVYVKSMASLLSLQYPVRAVVMEKTAPSLFSGGVKDGIHIVFPDVVTMSVEQFMIRTDVLKRLPLAVEDLRPSNSWSDVIDDNVIVKNNWMLYGSRKINCEPYLVTSVLSVSEDLVVSDASTEFPDGSDFGYWVPRLSIRNKFATVESLECRRGDLLAFEESMNIRSLQSASKPGGTGGAREPHPRMRNSDDYDVAKKFAGVLSAARAESYNSWIKVGWCLHNIDERLLDAWIDFSKKSRKYQEGECERLWRHGMREDALGMGSLSMWAKEDNPQMHAEINRQRILTLILRSCSGDQVTHHDVAVVVYSMYRHKYVCASIRNKLWYEFRDHRWRVSDSAYTLRQLIPTDVFQQYLSAGCYFQERASANAREADHNDSQKCLDKVKQINSAALKLKNVSFKDAIIRELSEMLFQESFEEKLNSKGNLLGFENGVYDLDANVFRDGQPEDYVSFSTGYNYMAPDPSDSNVSEIDDFFAKVFRSVPLRQYVIKTLSSSLHGGIRYERYNMWHGEHGANGKSKLLDLIEQTFGDYAVKFPVSLLTQKRVASNAATSELARSKGRRFASMQEPGEHETLNIGIMKELSGNDKIVARHLFHEAIEFRPCYKMFMCCNHLPAVPSQDGGTWRRIRVVQFTSRFCERPDPENPDEFMVDYDIDKKFESWRPHLMNMLIKVLPTVRCGIPEPMEVMQYTMNYKRSNDSITEFLDTFVRPSEPEDSVTLTVLLRTFKNWRRKELGLSQGPSGKGGGPSRAEFKSMADLYFGTKSKDRVEAWFGHRLLTDEEEAEEARLAAAVAAREREVCSEAKCPQGEGCDHRP